MGIPPGNSSVSDLKEMWGKPDKNHSGHLFLGRKLKRALGGLQTKVRETEPSASSTKFSPKSNRCGLVLKASFCSLKGNV